MEFDITLSAVVDATSWDDHAEYRNFLSRRWKTALGCWKAGFSDTENASFPEFLDFKGIFECFAFARVFFLYRRANFDCDIRLAVCNSREDGIV